MTNEEFYLLTASPKNAIEYLEGIRWKNGVYCPHCSSVKRISHRKKHGLHNCNNCGSSFSFLSKSVFANLKLNIDDCLRFLRLMLTLGKSMSVYRICGELKLNYKVGWLLAMKIRSGMAENTQEMLAFLSKHVNQELPSGKKDTAGELRQIDDAIGKFISSVSKQNYPVANINDVNALWNQVKTKMKRKYRNNSKLYFQYYLAEIAFFEKNKNNPNIFEDFLQDVFSKEKLFPQKIQGW